MKSCLEKYSQRMITESDFQITYHIGSAFTGETFFRVKGDGEFELWSTVTRGRQRRSYNGQVKFDQIVGLAKQFLEAELWQVTHVKQKPGEDDPEASIIVECGQQKSEVVLWISEIRKSPQFVKAQQALLVLIQLLSDGEILENGR